MTLKSQAKEIATERARVAVERNRAAQAATHTPGPWTADTLDEIDRRVAKRNGVLSINVHLGPESEDEDVMDEHCVVRGVNAEANAKLISAAPELLAACELALTAYEHLSHGMVVSGLPELMARTREAVAKAEGRAS